MLHQVMTVVDGIHYVQAWEVADAAALAALAPAITDVGKVARQIDTKQFYLLKNNVGPVWAQMALTNTDGLVEGATNLYFTAARVLATVLAGLSTAAGTTVTAAHTILQAIGFLQNQATTNATNIATNTAAVAANAAKLKQYIPIAVGDETTALTVGTGKVTFRMPFAMTVSAVRASLTTAQATSGAGGLLTIDVKEAGSTIFSTKPTFDNTEKSTTTAATASVLSDTSLADDAEITIDIVTIGDGTAKGLKVYLLGSIT